MNPPQIPAAWGPPLAAGQIRMTPADFQVDEILGFQPAGEGEHWLLRIRKRGRNTMDVVDALASCAGLRQRDIGMCGLKDRHAVTTQWFSLPWPVRADPPDWSALDASGAIEVLEQARHNRKLRRGTHQGNRFAIRAQLDTPVDAEALTQRVEQIRLGGVPNAFGPQRFGHGGRNLDRFMSARKPGGMLLSAARSAVFNAVLAERIVSGEWTRLLPGEWCMLDGSRSGFLAESPDDALMQRCAELDVHPSGPLPGRRGDGPSGVAAQVEDAVAAQWSTLTEKLADLRVDAARRALRVRVADVSVALSQDGHAESVFALPAGAFATSVLDQLFTLRDAQAP